MAATALLNTGGNLGGVVATPMLAALSTAQHWVPICILAAGLSIEAAVL
jgi:hypothetical protein